MDCITWDLLAAKEYELIKLILEAETTLKNVISI